MVTASWLMAQGWLGARPGPRLAPEPPGRSRGCPALPHCCHSIRNGRSGLPGAARELEMLLGRAVELPVHSTWPLGHPLRSKRQPLRSKLHSELLFGQICAVPRDSAPPRSVAHCSCMDMHRIAQVVMQNMRVWFVWLFEGVLGELQSTFDESMGCISWYFLIN